MIKYITVAHHKDTHLKVENGTVTGRIPIHDLVSNYYWARLDDDHILVKCSHPLATHKALEDHPKVVLLPYIHHRKTIHDHYKEKNRMDHHASLAQSLKLSQNDTMQELIDAAIATHGPVFAPNI